MTRMLASLLVASGLAVSLAPAPAMAQAPPTQPLVRVVDLVVDSVVFEGGELIANVTATLDIVGRIVELPGQIPLNLDASPGEGPCPILHLELGPLYLDLLGLVVELDDCNGGPVVLDITADPAGGLLGELLCAVANLLNGGLLDLGQILDLFPGLTGALTDLLNDFFADLIAEVGGGGVVAAAQHEDGAGNRCDVLNLELGPLDLDLLGLVVQTSEICLQVYALEAPGNLLGNLLCSLTDLLNNNGNNDRAELVLVRNVLRLLDRLGL